MHKIKWKYVLQLVEEVFCACLVSFSVSKSAVGGCISVDGRTVVSKDARNRLGHGVGGSSLWRD
jgi:hypothetical protein